jgi:membrane fusion protein (multidrug efflux system)
MEIFRKEALEAQNEYRGAGDILRLSPAWTRWSYWLLLGVLIAGFVYSVIGTVGEYASGPAIVRVEGRSELTARAAGTVAEVLVQPGQRVEAGRMLVTFYSAQERAELVRINHEFELELMKLLQNPTDQSAKNTLIGLRAQRDQARAHVLERQVRAPAAGVVSDIRIRAGQHLEAGEGILSLVGDDARFHVVAMLPGQYRPQLKVGARLKLELAGYAYAYQHLTIHSIGDEIVGPDEVRRFLGKEIADTVRLDGPVVLVEAELPVRAFTVDGRSYNFFDGMHAGAEVRVRTEPILVALVPALRSVFGRSGE